MRTWLAAVLAAVATRRQKTRRQPLHIFPMMRQV
jgi:hypothetical protein